VHLLTRIEFLWVLQRPTNALVPKEDTKKEEEPSARKRYEELENK